MGYPHVFGPLSGNVPMAFLDDNFNAAALAGANNDIASLGALNVVPAVIANAIASSGLAGFRNRVFNGAMLIDQRNGGASQTITAAAALAYTVDRFYAYCTGANVTGQQVAGPVANTKRYKFTGNTGNTLVGFGTRLEAANTAMMVSSPSVLQVKLSSSSITTMTWTAYYANTTDVFGTLASPTHTQIATGSWAINPTESTYSVPISVPAAATTGIEIVLSCGALLAGQTLTIGDIQFEPASAATAFENRPIGTELALCQRYYEKSFPVNTTPTNGGVGSFSTGAGVVGGMSSNTISNCCFFPFKVPKRAAPSLTNYGDNNGYWMVNGAFNVNAFLSVAANENGFSVGQQALGGIYPICGHYAASAEL